MSLPFSNTNYFLQHHSVIEKHLNKLCTRTTVQGKIKRMHEKMCLTTKTV